MAVAMKRTSDRVPRYAAIYARISKDREGAGLGVERQEADCRELAKRHGWVVGGLYADNDISAFKNRPRPRYRDLLSDIRSGVVDGLLIWHPDRLHRSPRELEEFIDVVEPVGLPVLTVQAGRWDLTTPAGRMVARNIGNVARYESEHQSEKLRRKHREIAQNGRPASRGGDRPFGYERDRETIVPEEAKAIRDAMKRLLGGESLWSVARRWNTGGIKTTAKRTFTASAVRKIMHSARIAGLREIDGERYKAIWPEIVDRAEWERLRVLLDDPARLKRRSVRKYLLTGFVRCGSCGQKMVARPRSAQCSRVLEQRARMATLVDELGALRRELRATTDAIGKATERSGYTLWVSVRSLTVPLETALRTDARLREVLASYGLWSSTKERLHTDAGELKRIIAARATKRAEHDSLAKRLASDGEHVVMSQKEALRKKVDRKCLTCGAAPLCVPTYTCAAGPGFGGCGKIRRLAEPVEETVTQMVFAAVDGPELQKALREKEREALKMRPTAVSIAPLERRLEELALDFARQRISRREWLVARDAVQGELDALLATARKDQRVSALGPYLAGNGVLARRWPTLEHGERRAIIAAVIDQVKVLPAVAGVNKFDPNLIEPVWRI
jgi:DNA invertase Pin-like site-specific DNA recombinase